MCDFLFQVMPADRTGRRRSQHVAPGDKAAVIPPGSERSDGRQVAAIRMSGLVGSAVAGLVAPGPGAIAQKAGAAAEISLPAVTVQAPHQAVSSRPRPRRIARVPT